MHPELNKLYYRLLGARIGKNVHIDKHARLGEFDLLTLEDGCRIDSSNIRGFCVNREGYFCLEPIVIGKRAVINSYTHISPGAVIPEDSVYGPHASSFDAPSPASYAAYNRTSFLEPHWLLKLLVAWPVILIVTFASCKCIGLASRQNLTLVQTFLGSSYSGSWCLTLKLPKLILGMPLSTLSIGFQVLKEFSGMLSLEWSERSAHHCYKCSLESSSSESSVSTRKVKHMRPPN